MDLKLLLFLAFLPCITAEIVYARTKRLNESEFNEWHKKCGMQSNKKKAPYKVVVHVSKKGGATTKCAGLIINKRFVLTTATCYYDRTKNSYEDDSEVRVATNPVNTKVVVCADDGISCDIGKGVKEVGVSKVIYPQMIHYSKEYEDVADFAFLEMSDDEFDDERALCTPRRDEMFKGQRVYLVSADITDVPYIEGEWEWKFGRSCGDPTTCTERYTFKPATAIKIKLSSGLFYMRLKDRMYLLGVLKYEGDSPQIMRIFDLFQDYFCSNTGNCGGKAYDEYEFFRETRVMVNGAPLPQVSHCDVVFTTCDYDPLFFRFIANKENDELRNRCGKELPKPAEAKEKWWYQHPYMAAIVSKTKGRACSGAFISQTHVVTVAHCLFIYDKEKGTDEFGALRDKPAGSYINAADYEVRYGSECFVDGMTSPKLDKCKERHQADAIKTSAVRSIIIEGIRKGGADWRYKYQLVLIELETPASKDVVVPICPFPGVMKRDASFPASSDDSFDLTAAGNPDAENYFVRATGMKVKATNCEEFREDNRIQDYNCRDDNVDFVMLSSNGPASSFSKSSVAFLGAQLSTYNHTTQTRYLYGLAPYFSDHGEKNNIGAFYPIWHNERFICWFTGVCHFGRPQSWENRLYKIYTPEYRLTRSVMDAPVQRAGANNLSNYEIVMLEEDDTVW